MSKRYRFVGRGAARSPSLVIVGRLGASLLALISAPIVARAIGPEGRGETAAALALFVITPVVLGLGMPLEVRRRAATSDSYAVMRTARIIVALSTPVAIGLAVLTYFTIFSNFSAEGRIAAAVGVALAPLSTSWALDISVLVAHRRYAGVLLIQLLQPSVYVALILLLWILDIAIVATIIAASILGTAAAFCAGVLLVRVPIRGERVAIRNLLRKGLTFSGSAIAEIASSRADQVIALPLIGAYQAGLYSVAATIGSAPLAIGHALAASYFSPIAQAEGKQRLLLQSEAVRAAIAITIIAIPPIAIVASATIPLVFGQEFAPSIPATMIYLVGSAGMLAAFVASMALAADGRGIRMTIAQVASLILGIAVLLVLGPIFGAVGAAIASTLGYLTLFGVVLLSLRLPIRSLVPRPIDVVATMKRLKRDPS